jgi:hypothetical protein
VVDEIWNTSAQILLAEGNMGFIIGIADEEFAQKLLNQSTLFERENILCSIVGQLSPKSTSCHNSVCDFSKLKEHYFNALQRFY